MIRFSRPLLLALVAVLLALGLWQATRSPITPPPVLSADSYELALRAARSGEPGAARLLYQQLGRKDLAPTARAALYPSLINYPSARALAFVQAGLAAPDASVRLAAAEAGSQLTEGKARVALLGPALADADLGVRRRAALGLVSVSQADLGPYADAASQVLAGYLVALESQSSVYNAQLELARLQLARANPAQAIAAARQALGLDPEALPARVLLAKALERQGSAAQARSLLAEPLRQQPNNPYLQHELGQWLLAHEQPEYALLALAKAVELAPDDGDFRYDLAVALYAMDQPEAAQAQLDQLVRRQPWNRKARLRLIDYYTRSGQLQNVQVLLAELEQQNPDDPILQQGL